MSFQNASDTVARFGGDEFAVLLEDLTDPSLSLILADRINVVLQEPYTLAAARVHVSASVGIAEYDAYDGCRTILRNADLAMYQAKATAAGGYALYDPACTRTYLAGPAEADLRRALQGDVDELVVYYQPLVEMRSGRVTGVEALVRWQHPSEG